LRELFSKYGGFYEEDYISITNYDMLPTSICEKEYGTGAG
jgi:hypothetical protein